MSTGKKKIQTLNLQVTEGLTVTILPDSNHEFLMPTKQVAEGYGVSEYAIRQHKKEHYLELIEGKHFISGVSIPHAASPGASKGTLWTKRGIVRLGFFIKSKRARLFRDWAEELIINEVSSTRSVEADYNVRSLPSRRKHNRLTPERLLDIMVDVAKIENHELRVSITGKLMGGA